MLLTLSDSYLSAYGSAGKKNPAEWHCFDWRVCTNCLYWDNCDPKCKHLKEIPFDRIGGFVFEPGNAGGLVKFPPKPLIQTLVSTITQHQGIVVVDEVTTGLGRTGTWYGFQHYDLRPDIVVLGKGLGNGYPVSATAMTKDTAQRVEKSGFCYAQSHQDDPLGCVIAKKVIDVIKEERLVERSARSGMYLLCELKRLQQRCDVIKEIRGRGLMIVIEYQSHVVLNSVYQELLKRGFIVGFKPAANLLRFYPPLTIREENIAQLLHSLNEILKAKK